VGDDDTVGKARIIMVKGLHFGCGVESALSMEVADMLFLLGVHADHRVASCLVAGLEFGNSFKLLVAVGGFFHCHFFWALRRRKLCFLSNCFTTVSLTTIPCSCCSNSAIWRRVRWVQRTSTCIGSP